MAESEVGLGLGSNIGDKPANIAEAMRLVAADGLVRVTAMSRVYRTPPWGKTDQDSFANAAAIVATSLAPLDLLAYVKRIEAHMGRVAAERWGPRLIDIDLLYYSGVKMEGPQLHLPHVDLFNRAFVLIPLAEIAPDLVVDGRTIGQSAAVMERLGVEIWR